MKPVSFNLDINKAAIMAQYGFDKVIGHCPKHGEFETWKKGDEPLQCPKCKQEEEHARQVEQDRLEYQRIKQAQAHIPTRYREKRFTNYQAVTEEQKNALAECQNFARNFAQHKHRSLVLVGGVGTGKTHLACSILNELILESPLNGLFVTVSETSRRIKNTWIRFNTSDYQETESDVIEQLIKPDLLVIDEVGLQQSDFEKNWLFDVLNQRYNANKGTVIISNLKGKDLVEYLGERAIDRLKEDGGKSLLMNWESFRKQ